jgi:pantetheine-phosphate adenylyltransferase
MKTCVIAGSLDPITCGHLWVIKEAASIFDEVQVLIAINPNKSCFFSDSDRLKMAEIAVANIPNVKVKMLGQEYVASYCERSGIEYFVRGIRNAQDLEYERTILRTNDRINPNLKTIFLVPPEKYSELSSSLVKGLVGFPNWQATIESMVPPEVVKGFMKKLYYKDLKVAWSGLFNGGQMDVFESLFERLLEPQRYYHNPQHIKELLALITAMTNDVPKSYNEDFIIKMAVWFHDAVYDPKAKDNEEQSQKLWQDFAMKANVDNQIVQWVSDIIIATKNHTLAPKSKLTDLFLDMDLAILGSTEARFAEYDKQIRKEYSFVPEDIYVKERAKILNLFLNTPDLFRTNYGKATWNAQAVKNLSNRKP